MGELGKRICQFPAGKTFPQTMYGTGSQEHPASIFLLWQNIIKKGYTRQDI
jgi:hypothetical protein